jgi:TRAP-type C4-dicarboxylate transport system permease small subunit
MLHGSDPKQSGVGGALGALCRVSAMIGGVVLIGMALMTLASVIGRVLWSSPIQGDVEMVQLACAVGIACFLPYTQWQGGNIIVDFFTTWASAQTQRRLDALGALMVGAVVGLICWRTVAGGMAAYAYEETSMLMAIPIWIPYALMTPGLLLTALVSCYIAWRRLLTGDPRE